MVRREGGGIQGVHFSVHGCHVYNFTNDDGRGPDAAAGLEAASLDAGSGIDGVKPAVRRRREERPVLRRQRADDRVVSLETPSGGTIGGVEGVDVSIVGAEVHKVANADGSAVDAFELQLIAFIGIRREYPTDDRGRAAVVDQVVVGHAVVLVVVRVVHALGAFLRLLARFGTAFVHGSVPIIVLRVGALRAGLRGHIGVHSRDLPALDGRIDGLAVVGQRWARPALRRRDASASSG